MSEPLVRPPTYPARPMNGGRLEEAEPLEGMWRFKPKWNGKRVLMHVPSERTWNRELEEINTSSHPAFHKLNLIIGLRWPEVEWLDLEFLWGRHSIAKGAVVVLDCVRIMPWDERNAMLKDCFTLDGLLRLGQRPEKNGVYFGCAFPDNNLFKPWAKMQEINKEWGVTFYEGLVAYETKQPYPMQLFSPKRETRHWIKYRFIN